VEGVDLLAADGAERRVLPQRQGMEHIDPEERIVGAISDAGESGIIGARSRAEVFGDPRDRTKPQRGERGLVEPGGGAEVGNPDAGMVEPPVGVL
jgi:hypothetical protein